MAIAHGGVPAAPQAPAVDVTSDTSSVEYQDAAEAFDDADDVLFVQEDRPKRAPLGEGRQESGWKVLCSTWTAGLLTAYLAGWGARYQPVT